MKGKFFVQLSTPNPFRISTAQTRMTHHEAMAHEGEQVAAEENRRIVDFLAGADLVVYDTQYTQAEYEASKIGWGHSPVEYAITAARHAGAKQMALFHHEPERTDQ
jgi:hypothetical protein